MSRINAYIGAVGLAMAMLQPAMSQPMNGMQRDTWVRRLSHPMNRMQRGSRQSHPMNRRQTGSGSGSGFGSGLECHFLLGFFEAPLYLVNAKSNVIVGPEEQQMTYTGMKMSIQLGEVDWASDFDGHMTFNVDGGNLQVENTAPWTLFGDNNNRGGNLKYKGERLSPGRHNLTIEAINPTNTYSCGFSEYFVLRAPTVPTTEPTTNPYWPEYSFGNSNCEGPGREPVRSLEECTYAGGQHPSDKPLGRASNLGNYKRASRPHGCMVVILPGQQRKLKFNAGGDSSADDDERLNICRVLLLDPAP